MLATYLNFPQPKQGFGYYQIRALPQRKPQPARVCGFFIACYQTALVPLTPQKISLIYFFD